MEAAKSPAESAAFTFDALVAHGLANGANIVNGMPWSFTYMGLPVTHENDNRYLVNMPDGTTLDVYRNASPAAPSGVSDADAQRVEKALRDALAYVGQRTDGDLATIAERAELWMRESKCLLSEPQPGRVEGMS